MSEQDPLDPNRCAELLGALAAPERLRIVRLLAGGRHNVTQIAQQLGILPVNLSHHLQMLRSANLIKGTRDGRFVWYALTQGLHKKIEQAGDMKDALDLGCCQLIMPQKAGVPARM